MAGVTVATLIAKLEAQTRDFDAKIARAESELRRLDATTGRVTKSMSGFGSTVRNMAGAAGLAFGVAAITRLATASLKAAVNAEEAGSAFRATFTETLPQVNKFVEEFAHMAGFANYELQQMLAITGNVVMGIGATEEQAALLSTRMATLAGDVASFSNAAGGAQAVMHALQSAINGEREALKTYGLALSEVEVQQKALEMTGKDNVAELSQLDKALATVELAYDKAGIAVGDLERTQDSSANQMRTAAAEWKEMQVQIGEGLIPMLDALIPVLKDGVIPAISGMADALIPLLGLMARLIGMANVVPGALAGVGVGFATFAIAAKLGLGAIVGGPEALVAGLLFASTQNEKFSTRLLRIANAPDSADRVLLGYRRTPGVRADEGMFGKPEQGKQAAIAMDPGRAAFEAAIAASAAEGIRAAAESTRVKQAEDAFGASLAAGFSESFRKHDGDLAATFADVLSAATLAHEVGSRMNILAGVGMGGFADGLTGSQEEIAAQLAAILGGPGSLQRMYELAMALENHFAAGFIAGLINDAARWQGLADWWATRGATDAGRYWAAFQGGPSFTSPPGGRFPAMHSGGVVGGPSGATVPIMAMAGERVVPAGVSSGSGGGGTVNVYVAGSVLSERDLVEVLRRARIRGGSLEL